MPPENKPQPKEEQRQMVADWIEATPPVRAMLVKRIGNGQRLRPHTVRGQLLLQGLAALGGGALLPEWARSQTPGLVRPQALGGDDIALTIGHVPLKIDGRMAHAVGINGSVPGPLIRLKEGQKVRLAVTNTLTDEEAKTLVQWVLSQ